MIIAKPNNQGIAKTLNKKMKAKQLTLLQIQKDTGIPFSTLSNWKLGRHKSISLNKNLLKLASYLEVSIEELMKN